MPLRQIEVVIPEEGKRISEELINDDSVEHFWQDKSSLQSGYLIKVLVDAAHSEIYLDKAEKLLGNIKNYRLVMLSVDATLPRIEEPEKEEQKKDDSPFWEQPLKGLGISREELYSSITNGIGLSRIYMAMVVLSTIVAALGILRDNTAVVIGAMVIAPLLAPNVGLALATTLGDAKLGWLSLRSNLAGLSAALVISMVLGFFMQVDESLYQIASRTEVHLSDITLALASGAAGVLAYTVGMSTAVIGVMVAVALLPPLVTAGLLLGDMQWELSIFAFLLLMTNVICVNLSAVTTFILQGIRPRTWYETENAKRANKIALTLWISLLLVVILIIYYI
ncbi:MAG: TIGR00341 family protein [Balneolales bacterium]